VIEQKQLHGAQAMGERRDPAVAVAAPSNVPCEQSLSERLAEAPSVLISAAARD
jgi:hypothetical protein